MVACAWLVSAGYDLMVICGFPCFCRILFSACRPASSVVDDSTAALLPERLARVEILSGLPCFTISIAPTLTYGVKSMTFARSGVIVIELMIALHFLDL